MWQAITHPSPHPTPSRSRPFFPGLIKSIRLTTLWAVSFQCQAPSTDICTFRTSRWKVIPDDIGAQRRTSCRTPGTSPSSAVRRSSTGTHRSELLVAGLSQWVVAWPEHTGCFQKRKGGVCGPPQDNHQMSSISGSCYHPGQRSMRHSSRRLSHWSRYTQSS